MTRALRALTLAAGALAALAASSPAGAELVVLTDGRFLKVRAYQLQGDRMQMTLAEGGILTMGLSRIERVVADEVPLPAEEVELAPLIETPPPPTLSWRFEQDHGVPATPYGELIFSTAEKHQVNPSLVAAVVRAESAFRSTAVSPKGACGLMQLMPATAHRFGVRGWEIFEPDKNLGAGVRYLRWLLDRYDDNLALALAAYNAGEGTVDRYRGVPPFRETRGYVRRIYGYLGLAAEEADASGLAGAVVAAGR
ncbi:MAG TPA: lytic transglycosylase domain-containing protein [Thermoanaerobaculia bacterium]|nr:lytic transglycosylase domain-containing protein [Thermoanaerobaculia bacterium]